MKYSYIHKDTSKVLSFNKPLNNTWYETGCTLEEYYKGRYIRLTRGQAQFAEDNPSATAAEILNQNISSNWKAAKLAEINTLDENSKKFIITDGYNTYSMWLDKDTRNSLYSITIPSLEAQNQTSITLWSNGNSIQVPIDFCKKLLEQLEVYAKQTYDITQQNIAKVNESEEDCTLLEYPEILSFSL